MGDKKDGGEKVLEGLGEIESGLPALTIPEVRSLVYGAFDGGEVDAVKYQKEFAKLDKAQRQEVLEFLKGKKSDAGRELASFSPSSSDPKFIEAIKGCIVVFKLLQAICAIDVPSESLTYFRYASLYSERLEAREKSMRIRKSTAESVSGVKESGFTFPEIDLDPRLRGIGSEMSPEVRTMINEALHAKNIDGSKYAAEFEKIDGSQRMVIFRFLVVLDDSISKELGVLARDRLNSSVSNTKYLFCVKRIILVLKLLKSIVPFINGIDGGFYDSAILGYERFLEHNEEIDPDKNLSDKDDSNVPKGIKDVNGANVKNRISILLG